MNIDAIDATYFSATIQDTDIVASKHPTRTNRRALPTNQEREIVAGDADVYDAYRY